MVKAALAEAGLCLRQAVRADSHAMAVLVNFAGEGLRHWVLLTKHI